MLDESPSSRDGQDEQSILALFNIQNLKKMNQDSVLIAGSQTYSLDKGCNLRLDFRLADGLGNLTFHLTICDIDLISETASKCVNVLLHILTSILC